MRQFLIVSALLCVHTAVCAADPLARRDEEVTFQSGSITIAGTLSLPAGRGPFPAVVLLSGSGPQNRDSEVFGFRPFKLMADFFVERGIAVLRCDDRGVGGSSGSVADATTEDFADDALAAVGMLRGRTGIDGARIGLLGHSEGAIVAAIAASRSPKVAFIVWMAGSAIRGDEIMRGQAADLARAAGVDAAGVDRIVLEHRRLMDAVRVDSDADEIARHVRVLARAQLGLLPEAQRKAMGDLDAVVEKMLAPQVAFLRSRWLRYFIDFDPATALAGVRCPVLAFFGARDMQVPPAVNRPPFETALARAGNDQVTVKVYSEANHLFQPAVTGNLTEYTTLPKAFVAPLLDDLAAWIATR